MQHRVLAILLSVSMFLTSSYSNASNGIDHPCWKFSGAAGILVGIGTIIASGFIIKAGMDCDSKDPKNKFPTNETIAYCSHFGGMSSNSPGLIPAGFTLATFGVIISAFGASGCCMRSCIVFDDPGEKRAYMTTTPTTYDSINS